MSEKAKLLLVCDSPEDADRLLSEAAKSHEGVVVKSPLRALAMLGRETFVGVFASAKYLEQVIELISEAMDELYPSETPDEATQRALARVIDRVGVITETPPALIALEIQKYRRGR